MSAAEALRRDQRPDLDPYKLGYHLHGGGGRDDATGRGEGGPASKRVIVGYGFWLFLLSDIVLFSCLFAAHAVLRNATRRMEVRPGRSCSIR
jgi:cytochrome o ubiquinol oxidase subunit III